MSKTNVEHYYKDNSKTLRYAEELFQSEVEKYERQCNAWKEQSKNMKSAKEMFKELGYKRLPKKYNKNMILYKNEISIIGITEPRKETKIIYFSLTDKKIQFSPYLRYSVQELKAINQQINELGWK